MRGWLIGLLIGILVMLGLVAGGSAANAGEQRVALVIGNASYQHATDLRNPRNDASSLAETLKELGFRVIHGTDLDKPALEAKVREFARQVSGADMALFFYAGHGIQVGGVNYLVPTDARLEDATALDFELVRLDMIQRLMEQSTRSNVVLLDACRDNPLARNLARSLGTRSTQIGKGLAAMESGSGTLISFSTQPGAVALDGAGRHSPYSAALLKHIKTPGNDVSSMLINVRNDVMEATRRTQVPWEHSALTSKLYFTPPSQSTAQDSAVEQQLDIALWSAVRESPHPSVVQTYLDRFPNGTFAALARERFASLQKQSRPAADAVPTGRGQTVEGQPRSDSNPQTADLSGGAGGGSTELAPPSLAGNEAAAARAVLARDAQRHLQRLGCYAGAIDGRWGDTSRAALVQFGRRANLTLPTTDPTVATIETLAARSDRVCPLQCAANEQETDGRCVAKLVAPKTEPKSVQPPRVVRCDPDENLVNGRCVPKPAPQAKKAQIQQAQKERPASGRTGGTCNAWMAGIGGDRASYGCVDERGRSCKAVHGQLICN